jgi:hypothetical protein
MFTYLCPQIHMTALIRQHIITSSVCKLRALSLARNLASYIYVHALRNWNACAPIFNSWWYSDDENGAWEGDQQLLNHSWCLISLTLTVSRNSVLNRDGFEPEILEHDSPWTIVLWQIEEQSSSPGSMHKIFVHTSLFLGFALESICFSSMSPSNICLRVNKIFITENQQIMQYTAQK